MRSIKKINVEYNQKWKKILSNINKIKYNKENKIDYIKELTRKFINPKKLNHPFIVFQDNILKVDIATKEFIFVNYFSDLIYQKTKNFKNVIELGSGYGLRSLVGSRNTKFYSGEINKYGRMAQKKITSKINQNTEPFYFDFNDIKSLKNFKTIKNKCVLSFTFFEQISKINEPDFKELTKIFKNTRFIFFEPLIINEKNEISIYNKKYCKSNNYNNNLLNLTKKYSKLFKLTKNVFCFSYSPKNIKIGTNVISMVEGSFR